MLDEVYTFLGLAGLDVVPDNLAELLPYLLEFIVAVVLVLAVFKLVSEIARLFFNGRWLR